MLPSMYLMHCPAMAVPMDVMQHVVNVESAFNPYAIGVVGGHLVRQPDNLPEALATVRMLENRGFNFSLGLAQVNRYNLGKYGLHSYESAFQACPNLQAGARILAECYNRSGNDWGRSFSCYYSGNFVTGYRHGYVQKIFASIRSSGASGATPAHAISVLGKPSRRTAGLSRYPVYEQPEASPRAFATADAAALINPAAVVVRASQPPTASQSSGVAMLVPNEQPSSAVQTTAPLVAQQTGTGISSDPAFVF